MLLCVLALPSAPADLPGMSVPTTKLSVPSTVASAASLSLTHTHTHTHTRDEEEKKKHDTHTQGAATPTLTHTQFLCFSHGTWAGGKLFCMCL